MELKSALKKHMSKGAGAHPDPAAKGLKKGGVTGKAMKAVGRNMARVNNQRGR
jgi:hypothetical protein